MKAKNKREIYISGKAAIAVIVTLVLLIGCLVPMFVGIAMDFADDDAYVPSGNAGNNGMPTIKNEEDKPIITKVGAKTGIELPSVTASGSYLCASDAATSDISAATSVKSAAMVLIDITDGRAVAQKQADVKVYPASMTKVMTLLVACENAKDPNALLTVTKEMTEKYAVNSQGSSGDGPSTAFKWETGYQVTVEDALHLIIYKSDTYACWLVADYVAGSEEAFVQMMNDKAASMGLSATNFTNCTGLYNDNHYTTCREMAAIMAAAMNNAAASAVITSISQYAVDIYIDGEITENSQSMWCNWYTSRLEAYRWGNAAAYYAGNGSNIKIIAGKTGYETLPTNCFVTAGVDDTSGRRYVCVQVGRTNDEQTKISSKVSTDDTRIVYQKYAVEK